MFAPVEIDGKLFPRFYVEIQKHHFEIEDKAGELLIDIAKKNNLPLVVTNDSHYVKQEDWEAHDILLRIGHNEKISGGGHDGYAGGHDYYLKSEAEMAELFPDLPEAMENTVKIAGMIGEDIIPQYGTKQLKDCLPVYRIPEGFATQELYLTYLVDEGLNKRYGADWKTARPDVTARRDHELDTILSMGFAGYFLIVWDYINWAKSQGIPIGPGRGSGAGSLVAYAIGITDVEPIRFGLFFERFLNPERVSMPDFDIDMSDEGRQAIIQYTRDKYGDDHVGQIVTFSSERARSVVADVGRVMEIPLNEVNDIKKKIPEVPKAHLVDAFEARVDKDTGDPIIPDGSGPAAQLAELRHSQDPIPGPNGALYTWEHFWDICFTLEECHRNTGLHASGIVIGKMALIDKITRRKKRRGKPSPRYSRLRRLPLPLLRGWRPTAFCPATPHRRVEKIAVAVLGL
jgi:DNA polymerase-3 subunit alpha